MQRKKPFLSRPSLVFFVDYSIHIHRDAIQKLLRPLGNFRVYRVEKELLPADRNTEV